jgi:sulfotransferase
MEKTLHFVCGMPRSGSTLLCNILLQNPRFHATQTSGLLDTLFGIRNHWGSIVEHKANPQPEKLSNVLKSVVNSYYEDVDRPIVFDKSRGWFAYVEFIENILNKKIKMLVPVRPVADILASFEVLFRETSKFNRPPGEADNYFQFQTVEGRCEYWMRNNQVVGLTLNRLNDALNRGFKDRMFFIDFNKLTSEPTKMMKQVYEFLGEKYYDHNFDYVEQVTQEEDSVYGFVNLHKIRNKVSPVKSRAEEILGKSIIKKIESMGVK